MSATVTVYTRHPASAVWPDMKEEEYEALKDSVSKVGVQEEILVTKDNLVVDGWHRLKACEETGKDPKIRVLGDITPEGVCELVMGLHKGRRHLSKEELAEATIAMFKASGMKLSSEAGGKPRVGAKPVITKQKVADTAGVSMSTARRALSKERSKDKPRSTKAKEREKEKTKAKNMEKELLLKEEELSDYRESINEMKESMSENGDHSHLVQTIERLKASNESLVKQVNEWMEKHAHQETIIKAQKAYIRKLEKESEQGDPEELDFSQDHEDLDFDDF